MRQVIVTENRIQPSKKDHIQLSLTITNENGYNHLVVLWMAITRRFPAGAGESPVLLDTLPEAAAGTSASRATTPAAAPEEVEAGAVVVCCLWVFVRALG